MFLSASFKKIAASSLEISSVYSPILTLKTILSSSAICCNSSSVLGVLVVVLVSLVVVFSLLLLVSFTDVLLLVALSLSVVEVLLLGAMFSSEELLVSSSKVFSVSSSKLLLFSMSVWLDELLLGVISDEVLVGVEVEVSPNNWLASATVIFLPLL